MKKESILDLHKKLVDREITSVQLVIDAFSAIGRYESDVNAFISLYKDEALAKAALIDARYESGETLPLVAGIPFSAKDAFNITGTMTTAASNVLKEYTSVYTATVIQRLLDAGAIFIGKTNMDCFGFGSSTENSDYKVTHNPWDLAKVPGGSSGGSAAAVATDMGVFSIAEDTGGSIRQPASFCGVCGLKVTYGRVPRYGTISYASSLDTIGPIARSVEEIAVIMEIIAGQDPHDATTLPASVPSYTESLSKESIKGLKIGVPTEFLGEEVDPEIKASLEEAFGIYKSKGAKIIDVSLPHTSYGVAAYYVIALSEASSNLSRYDGIRYEHSVRRGNTLEDIYLDSKTEGFNDEAKRRIMLGTYSLSSGYYDAYFDKAQRIRTLMKEDFEKAFKSVDVIVAPVSPVLPFAIGEISADPLAMWLVDVYSLPINIAGVPSLALPCGMSKSNLPIGMQIIGPQLSEELLLQVGYQYQQYTDWHKHEPAIMTNQ